MLRNSIKAFRRQMQFQKPSCCNKDDGEVQVPLNSVSTSNSSPMQRFGCLSFGFSFGSFRRTWLEFRICRCHAQTDADFRWIVNRQNRDWNRDSNTGENQTLLTFFGFSCRCRIWKCHWCWCECANLRVFMINEYFSKVIVFKFFNRCGSAGL